MPYLDLVADILQRVAEREGTLRVSDLQEIEQEVRADWGGDRHYIAKLGESGRIELAKRDRAICEAARDGVPEDYLSVRHNLSIRRIRQIIAAGNALPYSFPK